MSRELDGSPSLDAGDEERSGYAVAKPVVTLVEGSSFCVSGPSGDLDGALAEGLFVRDTRVLSRWQLRLDGAIVAPLAAVPAEPFECVFVGRAAPRGGNHDTTIVVERHRLVGQGLREDITLRNFGVEPAGVHLAIAVDADFADLFQVKEQRVSVRRPVAHRTAGSDLLFWLEEGSDRRGVRISAPDGRAHDHSLLFSAVVPAHGDWRTSVEVVPSVDGDELEVTYPIGTPVESAGPAARMRGWRAAAPTFTVGNPVLERALNWSQRDLGALRIVDPEHPEDAVVAAGAPWFMALFGRDSLITSMMTLPYLPELAHGTLAALARLQGERAVPMTDEEPGRILHEVRVGADLSLALGGDSVYYGSIDSTPLFVTAVGQAARWGMPSDQVRALLPAVDRALDWILHYGDRDGDGFVEYQRGTDNGLLHQGWKDSFDGVPFADGTQARPPIALCEVQAYCYAAFLAKAQLERDFGTPQGEQEWRGRASALKRRFHQAFWMPEAGTYALALDSDKRQVDSSTSNAGQCLWTGIVDDSVVDTVVDTLSTSELFNGFGVRTLSSASSAYNPVSYHDGSVWPHDSMLVALGIARSGRPVEADLLMRGLLDACGMLGGTLPELFCGFGRDEQRVPVPYPTSCSPQAWAAAVPFQLLSAAVNLDADLGRGVLRASPAPEFLGEVVIEGLDLDGARVTLRADAERVEATGLPAGVRFERVERGSRAWSVGARPS